MTALSAFPLIGASSESDLQAFHQFALMVTGGNSVADLLAALGKQLGYPVRFYPADQMPQGKRLVVAPLLLRNHHLGDLVADLPDDVDTVAFAGRLLFFAPVILLAISASPPPDPDSVQEERDRLEAVLEAANEAILLVDLQGMVVLATQPFERFTSIPRYEVLGRPVEQLALIVEDTIGLPPQMANMLRALVNNQTDSLGGEFEVDTPQRRILVWYSLPVYTRSGILLGRIFALRDATHERELDRMRTEFITLVSHELRTPLTSVKGFSDLILENGTEHLSEDVQEYLSIIALNADRLITLINDILDITRIQTDRVDLKPTLCPMQEVIWQVCTSLQPLLDKHGHKLVVDLQPFMPPCWADYARMIQIMTNLLTNAIKYTLEPGEITVRARYIHQEADLPSSAGSSPILPCVLVSVQDTGIGISPEEQKKVFHQFYRAKMESANLIGGTGLGLTIVKSFVEMHGGKVWLESTEGVGTTFFFTIPVVEGKTLPIG